MTAFIEKLARAMYDADRELHDMRLEAHTWETDEKRQPAYRALIRAVLQAAREPSPEMVKMGLFPQHLRSDIQGGSEQADAHWMECSWHSMIDQALSETPIDAGRG